jgi:predicted small lipoprotein YifL
MRKVYSIAVVAVLGFVFQGCGLKGPLRLPERNKPAAETKNESTPPANTSDNTAAPDKAKE